MARSIILGVSNDNCGDTTDNQQALHTNTIYPTSLQKQNECYWLSNSAATKGPAVETTHTSCCTHQQ